MWAYILKSQLKKPLPKNVYETDIPKTADMVFPDFVIGESDLNFLYSDGMGKHMTIIEQ